MKINSLLTQRPVKAALMLLMLVVVGITKSYAYDFSAVCETGQTLYYNITNAVNHYVELTPPSNTYPYWNGYTQPIGAIILPGYVYDADDNQYLVTSIGNCAFQNCSGLTGNLIIPNSMTSIGYNAFQNCSGLTGDLTIPNSVTSIGDGAFIGCSGLTGDLIIPNSVTSIGTGAFSGCSGLTSIIIPNSITMIGSNVFGGCSGLTSIAIPNSVTSIGYSAFSGCSGLTSITIPNSVTTIGHDAFYGCRGLTSMAIPNSVTLIGNRAFYGCRGLTSITIPNSLTSIGDEVFSGCWGLTSITIPGSVTMIGHSAFSGCIGLTSIAIPSSVTSIGKRAFYYCGLSSIIMLSITPPTMDPSAFSATSNTLRIYVPYESLGEYKTAANWSSYESRIYPWLQKCVAGYGESNDKWVFIASPLVEDADPTTVDNMISEIATDYDLYRFNQSVVLEWENYKEQGEHYHFALENGRGYLYANAEDVSLMFKGTFNENETEEVGLVYDAGNPFAGWNLVGNPFPVQAYANRSYYVMNENGTAIEPVAVSSEVAIEPCTGVMVKAEASETNPKVTFSKTAPDGQGNQGFMQIAVAQNNTRGNTVLDKAIVSFNEGDALGKFVFNEDNAKLWIPCGNEDLAIVCAEKTGEMPLNFRAKENGTYTISVNPDGVEMNYLHLIDNLTGADVDLLATSDYTFTAKSTDYASRFRLVFSANNENGASAGSATFAFVDASGNIIITDNNEDATLQIVDVMGRVIRGRDVARNVSTAGIPAGVYVLRLIDGNDVKTQKIVVE